MFSWNHYWSETSIPGIGEQYNIIDPRTGHVYPYVKSVDLELGILEEAFFAGYMKSGRPRPILRHGKILTKTRICSFDVVDKKSGVVLYKVRQG